MTSTGASSVHDWSLRDEASRCLKTLRIVGRGANDVWLVCITRTPLETLETMQTITKRMRVDYKKAELLVHYFPLVNLFLLSSMYLFLC